MKKCSKCKILKDEADFHKDKRLPSGLTYQCKECRTSSSLQYYKTDEGKENHRVNEAIRREKDLRITIFALAKQRAKNNDIEFSITINDILMPEKCPVLNIDLKTGSRKMHNNSPSLDRVNPKLGYTKDNIRVISWRANRLKSDSSPEELELILKYIYSNLPQYRNEFGKVKGQRPSKFYTFNGKSQGLTDWAKEFNISISTLNNRINRMSWDLEKALLTPVKKKGG